MNNFIIYNTTICSESIHYGLIINTIFGSDIHSYYSSALIVHFIFECLHSKWMLLDHIWPIIWMNGYSVNYNFVIDDNKIVHWIFLWKVALNPKNTVFDAKRLIGRRFDDQKIQEDIKHWPFTVINDNGKPKIQVEFKGETKKFAPEEVSSMVLVKMKEIAEVYLGGKITDAVVRLIFGLLSSDLNLFLYRSRFLPTLTMVRDKQRKMLERSLVLMSFVSSMNPQQLP